MTNKSNSNEWYYPEIEFVKLCYKHEIYPILDVAATKKYHLCDKYFTKKDDALTKEWLDDSWMNPPLGKGMTMKFIVKAYEQWKKHSIDILAIVPAGVISRQYFKPLWSDFISNKGIIVYPMDRPKFLYHGKKIEESARNDYITLVFKNER